MSREPTLSGRTSTTSAPTRSSPLATSCANGYRTLTTALEAAGERGGAATAARRALTLDEAKGNAVGAAATRRRIASLEPRMQPSP